MTLFRDTYRIKTARLAGFDYTRAGWYFVTTCTRDRMCVLGEVVDGHVRLSRVGEIVGEEWLRTPQVRPGVTLDDWVVMPNHLHGIIVITLDASSDARKSSSMQSGDVTPSADVPAGRLLSGSLGAIVGQFKSACTRRIRAEGFHAFAWQPRFHDQIIRDEKALNAIRQYMRDNPVRWDTDEENPANPGSHVLPPPTGRPPHDL